LELPPGLNSLSRPTGYYVNQEGVDAPSTQYRICSVCGALGYSRNAILGGSDVSNPGAALRVPDLLVGHDDIDELHPPDRDTRYSHRVLLPQGNRKSSL